MNTQQAVTTTIDLLRHGEPIGGRKFRGSVNDPLSVEGWAQMRMAVGNHCPWRMVVSSPLDRCALFARELCERHALDLEIESGFKELSFGDWDGRSVAELEEQQPQAVSNFWRDPLAYPPPASEPLPVFQTRVVAAWNALAQRHHGHHVLLVCHGGTIRVLLSHLLGVPLQNIWRLAVPYASVSRVQLFGHDEQSAPLLLFHAGILG